jgi:hypothetical protein
LAVSAGFVWLGGADFDAFGGGGWLARDRPWFEAGLFGTVASDMESQLALTEEDGASRRSLRGPCAASTTPAC